MWLNDKASRYILTYALLKDGYKKICSLKSTKEIWESQTQVLTLNQMKKNTLKRDKNISSLGILHRVKDIQWLVYNPLSNCSQ